MIINIAIMRNVYNVEKKVYIQQIIPRKYVTNILQHQIFA